MWPSGVVMNSPLLDQNPCLVQAVEQFAVQELISEFPVEALTVTVLPRAAGLDIRSPGADALPPVAPALGHELRPVVAANEARDTPLEHHVRKHVNHLQCLDMPGHIQRQALPRGYSSMRTSTRNLRQRLPKGQ